MNRKTILVIVVILSLLTGGIILCVTRWQAWFVNPAEPEWTADTLDYHFYCFGDDSVPGFVYDGCWQDTVQPDELKIILFGDVHNQISHACYDSVISREYDADCYAQLGDWFERGYFYYAQLLFHELQGTRFDSLPVMTCPGNHEYRKGIIRRLPQAWKTIFRHPVNGPVDFLGTTYYVDFRNLRFIVLDTNGLHFLRDYTRMLTWLRRALDVRGQRFTVVMMHHPVFSCGVGRQNVGINMFFRNALGKADIVFAGHDHNYSRRLPFINTNSAQKAYLNKVNAADERIASGHRFYEVLKVKADTLSVLTYLMDNGELYDYVQIIKTPDGHLVHDNASDWKEYIDLPERYIGKNSMKVKRFNKRREHRLSLRNEVSQK